MTDNNMTEHDKETRCLLATYLDGGSRPEDEALLGDLLQKNPAWRKELAELAMQDNMLRNMEWVERGGTDEEADILVRQIESRLQTDDSIVENIIARADMAVVEAPQNSSPVRFWRQVGLSLAAGIAVIAGVWMVGERVNNESHGRNRGEVVASVVEANETGSWVRLVGRGNSGKKKSLKLGDDVFVGDLIEVGDEEGVILEYVVGARARLSTGCVLSFEYPTSDSSTAKKYPITRLAKGNIFVEVAKQTKDKPFLIKTQQALVTVIGTRFSLTVNGDDSDASLIPDPKSKIPSTRLMVKKGLVQFTRLKDGNVIEVAAGQYAMAAMDEPFVVRESAALGLSDYVLGKMIFEDSFDDGLKNWTVLVGTDALNLVPAGENAGKIAVLRQREYLPHYLFAMSDQGDWMLTQVKLGGRKIEKSDTWNMACLLSKEPIADDTFSVEAFVSISGHISCLTPFPRARVMKTEFSDYWMNSMLPSVCNIRWECVSAGRSQDGEPLMKVMTYITPYRGTPSSPRSEKFFSTSLIACSDKRIGFMISNASNFWQIHRVLVRHLNED